MKNKTTASVLAFFLGAFGAHHFYLGNAGRGSIYLFFWAVVIFFLFTAPPLVFGLAGLIGLIAFVDFIMLVVQGDSSFNAEYNPGYVEETNKISTADELKKLFELKQSGAITEAEYEKKKQELL